MTEETTSQATQTAASKEQAAETKPATPEPASIDNTVDVEAEAEAQAVEFPSLFETENVSEAELRGEEEAALEGDKLPEGKSETKEAAASPPKDKKPEGEKAAEKAQDEQGKPPKGFVAIQALHQERGQRQLLTQEVQNLRAELEAVKQGREEIRGSEEEKQVEEEAFEVLSEAAFNELVEEDPVEAIKYDRKLRVYEARQADKAVEQDTVEQSIGMMAAAVPGLYDTDNDVNRKLSDFAAEKGFADVDGLALITDPRTRIISPDGGPPQILGETAANLVIMLNTLFQEVATPRTPTEVEKALTERIRAQVTKEVMSKIKQPAGAEHKSLGDIPGDAGDDATLMRAMTEADFAKLSEADQRRYLGG